MKANTNPYNISKKYDFTYNKFYSHKLNGISIFISPNSPEGKMIQLLRLRQFNAKTFQNPNHDRGRDYAFNIRNMKLENEINEIAKQIPKIKWDN